MGVGKEKVRVGDGRLGKEGKRFDVVVMLVGALQQVMKPADN